jgi:hypothetical protein
VQTRGTGTVSPSVAFEAIALQLAHDRGALTQVQLVEAFALIVSDVTTQADAFELLARLTKVAAGSLSAAAQHVGVGAEVLLQVSALQFTANGSV